MKRIPLSKGIYLIPNLCTTGSLFCGFYSIIRSISGDYYHAAVAVFFSAFLDMLDGRIARMTHSESDFGVEYDSLVDLASFGLAPAVLVYTWGLNSFHRIGWLAAFVYFACGALRLARFNVQIETLEKKKFQGLPIPLAGLTLASFVILCLSGYLSVPYSRAVALVLTLLLAPLMVSRVRYRSFKDLDFRSRDAFYALVAAVGVILVVAMNPELMPFFVFSGYILSGPIEEIILYQQRRLERGKHERRKGAKITVLPPVSEENR